MKWTSSLTFGAAVLASLATAQDTPTNDRQPTVSAPYENPWKALSEEEAASVNELLQERMSLTGNTGSSRDNFVVQLSLLHPNKTDTLPFLDNNATAPRRYARATIQSGTTNSTEKYWQEYLVGPLPATNATAVEPLTFPFQNSQPGRTPMHPLYSPNEASSFFTRFSTEVEDISMQLFNTTFFTGSIGLRLGSPFWDEEGRIISWAAAFADPGTKLSSVTVEPLGFAVKFDLTGQNSDNWKAVGWYSKGEFYASTDDFRAAINKPDYQKPPPNVLGNWTSTDRQGTPMPLDHLPPPASIAQGDQRFKIDAEEGYISWMDFTFYHAVSQDLGLSLFDIKYKGRRIIYELSLQEALTSYSGTDPFQSQATFFDTTSGMGSTLQPLIKGYDCPSHATYLPATWTEGDTLKTQAEAICIFEFDAGYPIRRHSFSPSAPHTSVAKNIQFVMRTVATVGNYDFMIDYSFFYDGGIEVSSRFSGYIAAAYWDGQPEYGFHIHDFLSGSSHDHTLTFKVDLDINGRKNSVQKLQFVPTSTTYPWSQGRVYNTFKAERSWVANESESKINWAENDNTLYAIVNRDTPNPYGEYPGYRIKRAAGTIHLTQTNSTNTGKTGAFVTHDFYVTQQKETEPRAADANNQFNKDDPLVDFASFFDEETLEQEDLVLWFNLGMHHLPHTGDLPNTMFSSAHSAMRFEPLNYLVGDPSVSSNQQVRIEYDDQGAVTNVDEFGKMSANTTCA
ncbi:hypothetical protein J4E82_010063 [Alternaria postmessia]|uniref:uncharacterized protein n=1 Tax=Alternaria postmessia TaxID=1187938 RepID=UPI0022251C23|nr:uncharacterized protein J4E82_010063 [Alternaria postmessia]KAI5371250.1 hypothetical protein J4E82_010063 [Alternaria postmessia]